MNPTLTSMAAAFLSLVAACVPDWAVAAASDDDVPRAAAGASTVALAPSAARSFILGVGIARRWGPSAIPYAKKLGVASVRSDAPWREVETRRGEYRVPDWLEQWVDAAVASGLAPVLILDYGNPLYTADKPATPEEVDAFRRYAVFLLTHFKGRVGTYELWNEWNNTVGGTTPGDPQSYIAFATQIVPALRSTDPTARILAQGVSPGGLRGGWLNRFLELKGAVPFDGVALHPYSWSWKTDRSPEAAMRLVDGYQEAARRNNGGKPVDFYITEMGWPTFHNELSESRDAAAAYLARFVLLAACKPYIRGVWLHTLVDDGTNMGDAEHNYGLYDTGHALKPSGVAVQQTAALLSRSNGCNASTDGDRVTLRLSMRGSTANTVVVWQGGNVAPGGAVLQGKPAGRKAAGSNFPDAGKPIFRTQADDSEGVPAVLEEPAR